MLVQNWILLRGLTRETGHWGSFPSQLKETFPNAQIHTLDLPGTGIFYRQPSPNSMPAIAQQIRQHALDKGWLESKATLLSLSLGSMAAWEWMQQFPEDINAAVLINGSLGNLNPFHQRLRWQCYGRLAQIVLQPDPYKRELAIIKLISNSTDHQMETARIWEQIQIQRPVSMQTTIRQITAAATYRPKPQKPLPAVLLLNSLGDRLVSSNCSVAISKRWALPLVTHPWAGHDLCLDDTEWLLEKLQEWMGRGAQTMTGSQASL